MMLQDNQSPSIMPLYYIYREGPTDQPFDPSAPLQFCPPKDSDELFFALRNAFPNVATHSERMRNAVISFLVNEGQTVHTSSHQSSPVINNESASTSPYSPYLSMDSSTSSFSASPPSLVFQTPAETPSSSTVAESSRSAASSSRPALEQMTTVFSVSSHSQPKLRSRRRMTEAEKIEYRKRRTAGACQACSARKRKCKHTKDNKSPGTTASTRPTKPLTQKSRGKQPQRQDFDPPPSAVQSFLTESSTTDSLLDFNDSDLIDFFNFDDASAARDTFTLQEPLIIPTDTVHASKSRAGLIPASSAPQPQHTQLRDLFNHGDFELFPQTPSAGFGEAHQISAGAPPAQILEGQPHLTGIESMLSQDPRGKLTRVQPNTPSSAIALDRPTPQTPLLVTIPASSDAQNPVYTETATSQPHELRYTVNPGANRASTVRPSAQVSHTAEQAVQSSQSSAHGLAGSFGQSVQSAQALQTLQPQALQPQPAGLQPGGLQPAGLRRGGQQNAASQTPGEQSAGQHEIGSPSSLLQTSSQQGSGSHSIPQNTSASPMALQVQGADNASQGAVSALLSLVTQTQWSLLCAMHSAADAVEQQPHRGMAEHMHAVAAF